MKEVLRERKGKKWIGECEKCGCVFQCDFEDIYSILRCILRHNGAMVERRGFSSFPDDNIAAYCKCPREKCNQDVECFIQNEEENIPIKSFSFNVSGYVPNELFCVDFNMIGKNDY